MAKFHGKVGYALLEESAPGVWKERITVREYDGDEHRLSRSLQASGQVNDNVNLNSEISIVADPFAYQHFHCMRYVEFMGTKWKVASVNTQRPRLILTLGGLYNGEQA